MSKADKKNNQQNKAHFTEEAQTLSKEKAAKRPPSLNNISKTST
ncbi:hypothetical protein [Paenibacillus ferrarius]